MTGLGGATALLVGICGPSCVTVAVITRVMDRRPDARWIALVRHGLAPLTIGLLLSTGWVSVHGVNNSFSTITLTVMTVSTRSFTHVYSLVLMELDVLVGGTGWI